MAFMTWSDDLVTSIGIVDEQHHGLVDMINQAAVLLLEKQSRDGKEIDALFSALLNYAAVHFKTEEDLMAAKQVDARVLAHHHHTHVSFVDKITEMAGQFGAGRLSSEDLLGFLAGWLLFHTLGEDQTMARQIKAIDARQTPADAYVLASGDRLEPDQNALARSMVTLYTQLSGQIRELGLHNHHLEDLVQDRTAHLHAMTVDLARARDAAEASSEAKSRFLGAVSHELRTPMNAVLGFARLLQQNDQPNRQSDLARQIVDSSEHLLGLINGVIDYARLDTGQAVIAHEDFPLRGCCETACADAFALARQKGIGSHLVIDPHLYRWLKGDAQHIASALKQFADNAVKFTERGAILVQLTRIAEEEGRQQVRFLVQDSGIGIPAERQEQLFQAFRQIDDSKARKYAGVGLGLALARHLVRQMGGEVGVESREGQGSRFWFDLWLDRGAGDEEAAAEAPKPVPETRPVAGAGGGYDPAAAEAVLQRVKALLEQDDTSVGTLFENSAGLLSRRLGDAYDAIARRVRDFDYAGAREAIAAAEHQEAVT